MKLNKEIEKLLKSLAESMPDAIYSSNEKQQISGEDALKTGLKLPNNESINPEKQYQFDSPVYYSCNHYNRLKRAFIRNGIEGVNNYLDKIKHAIQSDASHNS